MNRPVAVPKHRLLRYLGIGWACLILYSLIYQYLYSTSIYLHDYTTAFYVAGRLVTEGRTDKLYPGHSAITFDHTPFIAEARRMMPEIPETLTFSYMYMPIVAWAFAPLSLLPPKLSLLVWQCIQLAALSTCSLVIARAIKAATTRKVPFLGWYILGFLPVINCLWSGQVGTVFGVLPFSLGYYFLMLRSPLLAGFCFALAGVKPQLLIPGLYVAGLLAIERQFLCLGALLVGLLLIALINIVVAGPHLCLDWLWTLKLSETVFSDPKLTVSHLVANVPRPVVLLMPEQVRNLIRPFVYTLCLAFPVIGLWMNRKMFRAPETVKLSLIALTGLLTTPLIVPHINLYDLSILIPAGLIIASMEWPENLGHQLKTVLIYAWIAINIYAYVALAFPKFAQPIIISILLVDIYRRVILAQKDYAVSGSF
jgi:hypothetical protein